MEIFSHAKVINGKRTGSKLLKDHLSGVYKKATQSYYFKSRLYLSRESFERAVKEISLLHDLGKYTTYFQKYLLGEKVNNNLKNHSLLGAIYALNKHNEDPFYAAFLYFIIINHHSNLNNILETGLFLYDLIETNYTRAQIENLKKHRQIISKEIGLDDLDNLLSFPSGDTQKRIRKAVRLAIKKEPTTLYYFTINYLFSLLIEADKLDASGTTQYVRKSLPENAVEKLIGKAQLSKIPPISEITGSQQNTLRNWVRASVIENLNNEKILERNLFTLTAPTGIGKTLTALDFALRLRKMIREHESFEPQIIYGLPFINIIEQGLDVYNRVFENHDINILGHYQYADVFGKEKDTENYNTKLMQLNTWQSDILITSFVQFFETLIGNRNKLLLKFNHFAGAIVILDEVQTLRLELLPLIGAVLFYLAKYLNTRIILMTATKPKIFELANAEILEKEGEKAQSFELLKDFKKIFSKFNRTKIIPYLDNPIVSDDEFFDFFIDKRSEKQSCLIVCNIVQRSINIYNKLKENNIKNLYYLSTNIVPAVRLEIIEKIKKDILRGKAPVLVSTQVVEAGVDLDFDIGFRDLGPMDSIIQVAGRINRENNRKKTLSPLYIIEFQKEDGKYESAMVYDTLTRDQVKKTLKGISELEEKDYFTVIDKYFSSIAQKEAFVHSRKIFESMKTLNYYSDTDGSISHFKIIKESPWAISVYVELNEEAITAREAYGKLLNSEISKEDFDKKFKKSFNKYIIAVPEKFTEALENINEYTENIKLIANPFIDAFYDRNTGFKRIIAGETETFIL